MNNTQKETIGAMLYQSDLKERPAYHDGSKRPEWEQLQPLAKWTWSKDASALVESAREWLASNAWNQVSKREVSAMEPERIALGVLLHYSGGLIEFERAEVR